MWIIFSGNRRSEGFVWFRGPSEALRHCHRVTVGTLSSERLIWLLLQWQVFQGFFFCQYFVEAFCGAQAGCAAEETVWAMAKLNRFLWVKQKLVVSYYMLRWQGRRASAQTLGENRWLPQPRTISAHIPYWHICRGFYTVLRIQLLELTPTELLFHTFPKVTADLFFIPVNITYNWFSANDYKPQQLKGINQT